MGIDILSLGVYDVIAHFNDGAIASLEILKDMNMEPSDHMMKGLQIQNESRKIHAAHWMCEPQLKRRKIIRHFRKKKQDKNIKSITKNENFENERMHILLSIYFGLSTCSFFNRKTIFCLSLSFLNIMLEIKLRVFLLFFLTFISLFSLILYLIRVNTINKSHFLKNGGRKEF